MTDNHKSADQIRDLIESGATALGIEFGSTRIKALLVDDHGVPLAAGSFDWENQLIDGMWSYDLAEVWQGLRDCFQALAADVIFRYGTQLTTVGSLGVSGMMHGYLALDIEGNLLVPFRTWRNTMTGQASAELTALFQRNIPLRWSIAHLYQAILNKEDHVSRVRTLTTLAGYIHWQLTGRHVMGIGEASGMFPIDLATGDFDASMIDRFEHLIDNHQFDWELRDILPEVLLAGDSGGELTVAGAMLLDPSGKLLPRVPLCPPEGDAGTGMVATNSIAPRTGNASAGTSVFAMVVLERELNGVHPELDLITTPDGRLVAMVHSNNCTSDLNAWVDLFAEFASAIGCPLEPHVLFNTLYNLGMKGESDGGGLLAYNYLSGEHLTGLEQGRPLFARTTTSRFTLANFIRTHLMTAFGALRIGMEILFEQEQVRLDRLFAHGGMFKTHGVAQTILAGALNTPVAVGETAGEGGAWGMAILACYHANKEGRSLDDFLTSTVFSSDENSASVIHPDQGDKEGFDRFMEVYRRGLPIERTAVHLL